MKKLLNILMVVFLLACNNDKSTENDNFESKDPKTVQPIGDAIPDSMTLRNDSVIVPEGTP